MPVGVARRRCALETVEKVVTASKGKGGPASGPASGCAYRLETGCAGLCPVPFDALIFAKAFRIFAKALWHFLADPRMFLLISGG